MFIRAPRSRPFIAHWARHIVRGSVCRRSASASASLAPLHTRDTSKVERSTVRPLDVAPRRSYIRKRRISPLFVGSHKIVRSPINIVITLSTVSPPCGRNRRKKQLSAYPNGCWGWLLVAASAQRIVRQSSDIGILSVGSWVEPTAVFNCWFSDGLASQRKNAKDDQSVAVVTRRGLNVKWNTIVFCVGYWRLSRQRGTLSRAK